MSYYASRTQILNTEFSKLYESEFNNPNIHDKVLIFDVVASWPRRPGSERTSTGSQSEDKSDTTENENMQGISVNTSNETRIDDGDRHDLNVIQQTEMTLSNEREDNHTGTAIDQNKTDLTDNKTSIKMQDANKTEGTEGSENEKPDESKNTNDGNDATSSLNVKEKSENSNETLSESNEAMSYPTSEEAIIRQHKFYVHSTWLAVQSSYFRSLFFGGMKESSSTEVHIQISESEEQAHLMLLEAMYKIDTLNNARVDELLNVLKLADKYDVKIVFKKAKYCLQVRVRSLNTCEKIMRFIKVDNTITDVEDLASTLQSFLAKEFSPLDKTWQTTSFRKLCEPSLRYLLSSDELVAASENTIFHALMYWIEQHGIESVSESKEIPSLLSTVRFELISFDYLYNIVQHDAVAKKFPDFHSHYLRGISYHAMSNGIRETLHNQPAKRKDITSTTFIPYTWVIPIDELDVLVETDEELKSDEFWYCGYGIVLTISCVKKPENYRNKEKSRNKERFNAIISLEITNLKQHSGVKISWSTKSKAYTYGSEINEHIFKESAHKSMMNIQYEIEVNQNKKNMKLTPLAPSVGFNFGAPKEHIIFGGPALAVAKPCSTRGFVPPKEHLVFAAPVLPVAMPCFAQKTSMVIDVNMNLV